MMTLSLMRAVVATLNEQWESPLAEEILAPWAYDPGSLFYVRASANFLFVFTHAGQRYVLRCNHASERSLAFVQAELHYLDYLANAGLPVVKPVRSRFGNDLEAVQTTQGLFYAVVFALLPGKQLEFGELTLDQFVAWGRALGELHHAAQSYSGEGRPSWQDQLVWVEQSLPPEEKAARTTLEKLDKALRRLPSHPQNFGLIHFDFELDNLVWDETQIGIIDFDDCAWYWWAADISFALRDLYDDDPDQIDLSRRELRAFVSGYRLAKELTQTDLEALPLFLRLHNVISFTKALRTLQPVEQADDPSWLQELRRKLVRKVNAYRASFVEFACA